MAFFQIGEKTIVKTSGNEETCKELVGDIRVLLHSLRNQIALGSMGGMPIYRMERKYPDGSIIRALSVHGREQVEVWRPLTGGKGQRKMETEKWHVFFTGYDQVSGGYDWRVNKTKNDGTTEWDKYITGAGYYYSAYKTAADEKGAVYTVGVSFKYSGDLGYYDEYNWTIEKRKKNGDQAWKIENASGYAIDVAVDSTGVYIVGRGYNGVFNGSFVCVEKRKLSDGSLVWQQNYTKLGTYDRAVACAVAKDYLYVSAYAELDTSPQTTQGRVLTVNKNTGAVESTYYGTVYEDPFARSSMDEIALCVKDINKTGTSNVVMMTDRWVKTLDGELHIDVEYDYVLTDYLTIDKAVAADETGIYTVGQIPHVAYTFKGYEVCKWDYDGNLVWNTVYNTGAGLNIGPFLSDIAIDDKYVYVSGHDKQSGTTKAIRQALDKKTGVVKWTHLDTDHTYNYLWGVASTVISTEQTYEE